MIHMSRVFQAPSVGVRFADYLLLHPTLRINLKIRSGGIMDDRLFGTVMRPLEKDRSFLIVQLSGRSLCTVASKAHELLEGSLVAGRRNLGVRQRQEGDHRSLYVEWETAVWGEGPVGVGEKLRLPSHAFAELKERAGSLVGARLGPVEARQAAARIMETLRGLVPRGPLEAGALGHQVESNFLTLAHGLDRLYASMSSGNPAVSDLQAILGWSRPRIHRTLTRYQQAYAFHGVGGWRELHRWWRMPLGTLLMSAPKATTEEVASILGYSSPSAFCAAFAMSGLPSPGEIPGALARLR